MGERDQGEDDRPDDGQRDAEDGCQERVEPRLEEGERRERDPPRALEPVGRVRLRDDVTVRQL